GRWSGPRQLAMTNHAHRKYGEAVEHDQQQRSGVVNGAMRAHCNTDGSRVQRPKDAARIPARAVEGQNERKEIKTERQKPKERNSRNVLTQKIGRGKKN